ncbi:MAG: ADP-ribosylglycohydrolase family protein [Deltaproteobacteria bacterium]|nr:ADP-ribosylglycohydrolase family protein [Deltaproteobacteria bacterium]
MRLDFKGKYLGCLIGSALGDAIGELAFRFPDRNRLESAVKQAKILHYTDDTAMALGLAESLAERGLLDQEHLGRIFHRNFFNEPWRGYAAGPPTVFKAVQGTGISFVEAARRLFGGTGSFGNGAAMRVAPLGLFFHDSPNLYEQAAASAAVTHAHPLGRDGAAVQALAVAQALKLDPEKPFPLEDFLKDLLAGARTQEMREKLQILRDLLVSAVPAGEAARTLGRSVAVHESLPFALFAFLSHPRAYPDCLWCAVLNGGDRDTLGAMAGAVSGAYLGLAAIPPEWQEKLENREVIERAALALLKRTAP